MPKIIDYQKELNPNQLEAVQSTEGPHLVIAGAGSGKTRVLVYRVAYLVEKAVSPEQILLLTFTRRAAEEMLRRASLILDERCQKVSGGTFHSFANFVLRRYGAFLGLKSSFTILDRADSEAAINLIRTKFGFNKLKKRFPQKTALLDLISKSINKSALLEEILYSEYPHFIGWTGEINKIRDEYSKYKRMNYLLDYDDLLVFLKDLLNDCEDARVSLSKRYRYIMVDEYQDTNKLQAKIVYLLASEYKNIMVVGDDSQSIYSFRGADFNNIVDFPKIFKSAKIITLEENYRSNQPILNLTNEVINSAEVKFEKKLFTRKSGGKLPAYIETYDEHHQSKYVADKILDLRNEGVDLSDIAVLFRSGWHSNDLEIELSSRNVPFVKYGGQKFAEASHVKDCLSYARVVYNIFDQLSWYRILLLLSGIGPKKAENIIGKIILEGVNAIDDANKMFSKFPKLKELFELLKDIRMSSCLPSEILQKFLEYYEPLLKEKYDDPNRRLNDLDSLIRIASRYDSLEKFLSDMSLEPPERNVVDKDIKERNSHLTLSTIHSAKGLEWDTVFIIYLADGYMPSYLSLEDDRLIEEERRLLYVAATRAKENLFLLKPNIDHSPRNYLGENSSQFTNICRFLDEPNILKKLIIVENKDRDYPDAIDFRI